MPARISSPCIATARSRSQVFDEFLLCLGSLVGYSKAVPEIIAGHAQETGLLCQILDLFLADDLLQRFAFLLESGATKLEASQELGESATMAHQAAGLAHVRRTGHGHGTLLRRPASANESAQSRQETQSWLLEHLEAVRAGRTHKAGRRWSVDATTAEASKKVTSPGMTADEDEWQHEARRGGPERRAHEQLAANRAFGVDLVEEAGRLKAESELAEGGANQQRIFRRYAQYY